MDSSDEDSSNSIPQPIYEAISAIDSPQPTLLTELNGSSVQPPLQQHSKHLNYMVSALPANTANGLGLHASSSLSPALGSGAPHNQHSLTMKLLKVNRLPNDAGTPEATKPRVPKEMVALMKSHDESQVLSAYVSATSNLKRRKSRCLQKAEQMSDSTNDVKPVPLKMSLKRSKSISAPVSDNERCELQQLPVQHTTNQKHPTYLAAEWERSKRFCERRKTIALSNGEPLPRRSNMRSENEEFVKKHNAFLSRIINDEYTPPDISQREQSQLESDETEPSSGDWLPLDAEPSVSMYSDISEPPKAGSLPPEALDAAVHIDQRLSELWQAPPRAGWDPFCWKCRKCGNLMPCSKCLRAFHPYCVRPATIKFDDSWKCPECLLVESATKRPRRNDVSVDLSKLLAYALERMENVRGASKLRSPKDVLPHNYGKYFVNPVTFASLSLRIQNRSFHNVEEFLSEVKWMQHNVLILDAGDVKIEQASKAVVKVCRQEANEIETCAECYLNAYSSEEWFVKVCTQPHLLLWAKLKGFPYWPAKAMGLGPNSLVNVRFFGKHDRANVPIKECFLYSAQDPNTQSSRRSARDLAECIKEVEVHIEQIKLKIGCFNYAPYRQPYDPAEEYQQLEQMMPGVHEYIKRQLMPANLPPLQFFIRKTAGDQLAMVKKTSKATESGNESDQSISPSKQPAESQSSSSEHPKPHSSNYEVIPKRADPLSESRSCTVIIKRKSLEGSKQAAKQLSSTELTQPSASKRKHSLSDASICSETSQRGGGEHKRRLKHSRRPNEREPTPLMMVPKFGHKSEEATSSCSNKIEAGHKTEATSPNLPGPTSEVVSFVKLVQSRQGITITKIPSGKAATNESEGISEAEDPGAATAGVKQADVARQQKQIISKVVPFVEIKEEVLSETEENGAEDTAAKQSCSPASDSPDISLRVPEAASSANPENVKPPSKSSPQAGNELTTQVNTETVEMAAAGDSVADAALVAATEQLVTEIKKEIMSDDEREPISSISNKITQVEQELQQPDSPQQQHSTQRAAQADVCATTPISTLAATDAFVRYVGDTTIQRLVNKSTQAANPASATSGSRANDAKKLKEDLNKRTTLKGVPYGPLPAAAQVPMPEIMATVNKLANAKPTKPQRPETIPQARIKTDKTLNEVPTSAPLPQPPSNIPKSTMVVIPVDVAQPQQAARNASANQSGNIMTSIPVPPLTAVSKSTLQNSAQTLPINAEVPPPSTASLSGTTTSITTATSFVTSVDLKSSTTTTTANGVRSELAEMPANSEPDQPQTRGVASAFSELLMCGGPPKLIERPRGPLHSDGASILPNQEGPVSQRLKQNAHKITDYFISVIEDTLSDLGNQEPSLLEARIAGLTLENERLRQHYERQLTDMRRSSDLLIVEMRKSLENEHRRAINELRQQSVLERLRVVEETKRTQWCANCLREANLYCCWNTSYCDYPCQQLHWARHSTSCGQNQSAQPNTASQSTNNPISGSQLQQQTPQQPEQMTTRKHKVSPNSASFKPFHQVPTSLATLAAIPGPAATLKKCWGPQPLQQQQQQQQQQATMLSVMNSTAEVLKLPNNTFLRPVGVLPASTAATLASNTLVNSNSLINPAGVRNSSTILAGGRNTNVNFVAQQQPQPQHKSPPNMPVQRYNISCPITVSSPYGIVAQQHQKPTSKSSSRSQGKSNHRVNNNHSQPQGVRSNQPNQVFQRTPMSFSHAIQMKLTRGAMDKYALTMNNDFMSQV